jgi:DNA/RNA-binding domain of Phe-tRNA-synthetase-like protein
VIFHVSEEWAAAYPRAHVGVLAMNRVANPEQSAALDRVKAELEADLRARFAGHKAELRALPTLQAYKAYYKTFKKTYHVQMQLESVALKGQSIPRVAALVEAMFVAELRNLLLTAGHDLDAVRPPVGVDVGRGDERYVRLNGQEQVLKAGDMFIADAEGILSSIIYGPDRRTQIAPGTTRALFTVYAPAGIDEETVSRHLADIEANVRLVAPGAETEWLQVYGAA